MSLLIFLPALASGAPRLYVSCEDQGAIATLDAATGAKLGVWPVGKRPRGVRVSSDGKTLYVALSGSPKAGPGVDETKLPPADRSADGIGILDVGTGKLERTIESGQDPETFALSPNGKTLYVSNEESAQASFVDVQLGKVTATIGVGGEPEGVAVRPDGKVVYVTSENAGDVAAIDVAKRRVLRRVKVAPRPRSVVFDATGTRAYVSSENGAMVTVIDAHRHEKIGTIAIPNDLVTGPLGARPMGLALSRDGKTLYVSNGRGGTVSVVDTAARKVVRTIGDVGARPWGIALSDDGKTLYTANGPSNDVSLIDVATGKVTKAAACSGPWGIALGR